MSRSSSFGRPATFFLFFKKKTKLLGLAHKQEGISNKMICFPCCVGRTMTNRRTLMSWCAVLVVLMNALGILNPQLATNLQVIGTSFSIEGTEVTSLATDSNRKLDVDALPQNSTSANASLLHVATNRTVDGGALPVLVQNSTSEVASLLHVATNRTLDGGALPVLVQNSTSTLLKAQSFEPKDFGSVVTDDFLQSCVESSYQFFKNNLTEEEMEPAMQLYKLSDCIKMCHCYHPKFCANIPPCHWKTLSGKGKNKRFPPDTISELYMRDACPRAGNDTGMHLEILDRIFAEKRGKPGFDIIPNRTTFLIHLRLGDMISDDYTPIDVLTLLKQGGMSKRMKDRYFPSVVQYLQEIHKATQHYGYENVELIGGSHQGGKHALKGMVYAKCLEDSIRIAGYNVNAQTSQGYHPDSHFFYASHATRVLVSVGGYSRLIGVMAKRLGGEALGPLGPPADDPPAPPTSKSVASSRH